MCLCVCVSAFASASVPLSVYASMLVFVCVCARVGAANEQQDGEQQWHSRQEAKRDALRWSALVYTLC